MQLATAGSNLPAVFLYPKFQLSIACYRITRSSHQGATHMKPLTKTALMITFLAVVGGAARYLIRQSHQSRV